PKYFSMWGVHRLVANVVLKDMPNPGGVPATRSRLQDLIDEQFGGIVRAGTIRESFPMEGLYQIELSTSQMCGALVDMSWHVEVFDTGVITNLMRRRLLPRYAAQFMCQTPGIFGLERAYEASHRFAFRWRGTA